MTFDQYIETFSDQPVVHQRLVQLRAIIEDELQRLEVTREEAFSYQMPTYKLNGNLVHFAGYKNHVGFYPTPSATEAFQEELMQYKHAKGSVQFAHDKPLPEAFIRKMVAFRVEEQRNKPVKKTPGGKK